ncbi:MAG: metal ABC transporter substrate-binding protein [Spirochaetia bacterium]|nr:metal ABC transporter substrate-binding protein [Spirochaetia bacterium]
MSKSKKISKSKKAGKVPVLGGVFLAAIAVCGIFAGCRKKDGGLAGNLPSEDRKISVVATIFPEYDWVKNLIEGVEGVELELLLKNGTDLHSYQPGTADIVKISNADLFIYVGGESDFWVSQVLKNSGNKNQFVVSLMEILSQEAKEEETVEGMQVSEAHDHWEGEGGSREEGEAHEDGEEEIEYDEHLWLSVKNAKKAVVKIAEYLEVLDLENSSLYAKNLENYLAQLEGLLTYGEELKKNSGFSEKPLIFCDRFPFRYMTDELGLKYLAAFSGCSAETEASFETIAFLSQKVREFDQNKVFVTETSDKKIAETVIKNAGFDGKCRIVSVDSMQSATQAQIKAGKNYIGVMKENYSKIFE